MTGLCIGPWWHEKAISHLLIIMLLSLVIMYPDVAQMIETSLMLWNIFLEVCSYWHFCEVGVLSSLPGMPQDKATSLAIETWW